MHVETGDLYRCVRIHLLQLVIDVDESMDVVTLMEHDTRGKDAMYHQMYVWYADVETCEEWLANGTWELMGRSTCD